MARRISKAQRQQAIAQAVGHTQEQALVALHEAEVTQEQAQEQGHEPTEAEVIAAVAETHEKALAPHSVVRPAYKKAYAERAIRAGHNTKAAKRANGDWLARELEAEVIGEGGAFLMSRFCAICELNGVGNPMTRWPNRNNGWEGRMRMSGSIVLRGIVRKSHVLITPDTTVQVPESFWQDAQ